LRRSIGVRSNVDRSQSALIFKKFLEDQLYVDLQPERSSLDGKTSRDATTEPGDTVMTSRLNIFRTLVRLLGFHHQRADAGPPPVL
jgi:hypothetical protein